MVEFKYNFLAFAFAALSLAFIMLALPLISAAFVGYEILVCCLAMAIIFSFETILIIKIIKMDYSSK